MSKRSLALLVFLCLASALPIQAQSARGRMFLPNGQPLSQSISFILTSDDARFVPQHNYTDGKGWFFLNRLHANERYSITVESDGETWADTTVWFLAGNDQHDQSVFVNVSLLPMGPKEFVSKSSTVSVQQLQYKPRPDAKRAFEEGQKAFAEKKVELARQKFRQAIELDPGYVSAYNDLGALEIDAKRYAQAEPWLRTAIEKDPEAVLPLLNLGILLDYTGRYGEAVPLLRKNLQLRPLWITPKVYLGIALVETGALEDGERLLLRGIAAKTSGREAALTNLYLGKLYAIKGEREKAITAFEHYLELDPDSPNATQVRDLLARLRPPPSSPERF